MQGVGLGEGATLPVIDPTLVPPSKSGPSSTTAVIAADNTIDAPRSPGAVVAAFYRAFEGRNFERMSALYHPDVKFKDMVFEYGDRAGTMNMWRKILADPSTQLHFTLDRVEGDTVHGHWVADYKVFGRPVHNELTTQMVVRDGQIVSHQDQSDWNKWAPQAFPLGHIATIPGLKQLAIALIRHSIDN